VIHVTQVQHFDTAAPAADERQVGAATGSGVDSTGDGDDATDDYDNVQLLVCWDNRLIALAGKYSIIVIIIIIIIRVLFLQ
jgi:hypothetical protein